MPKSRRGTVFEAMFKFLDYFGQKYRVDEFKRRYHSTVIKHALKNTACTSPGKFKECCDHYEKKLNLKRTKQ
jgi:hypothetical protein